jgi:nucleoside-diphosphate-sugar epimerase
MQKQILIPGGAGFVGSYLADELLGRDYRVRALDNLSPQVHGHEIGELADWLAGQTAADHVAPASPELEGKGLTLSTTPSER